MSDKIINPAGGAGTTAGTIFQENVALWYACHIIAERSVDLFDLGKSIFFEDILCETTHAIDDIAIGLSNGGQIFIQAKTSLTLSDSKKSEFNKVDRVAGGCCQPQAPSEPCLIVSHHTAQAFQRLSLSRPPGCSRYMSFWQSTVIAIPCQGALCEGGTF